MDQDCASAARHHSRDYLIGLQAAALSHEPWALRGTARHRAGGKRSHPRAAQHKQIQPRL